MNTVWAYDENSGRYVIRNCRVMYANFEGAEQQYNQAGKRNFKLVIPEDLAEELKARGINVREMESREDDDERRFLVKIGVYPDADIRLESGRMLTKMHIPSSNKDEDDDGRMIDMEFRAGHVKNGECKMEFHVSRNTRITSASPYLRVDVMIIPVRKSSLLEEYEDDVLPM